MQSITSGFTPMRKIAALVAIFALVFSPLAGVQFASAAAGEVNTVTGSCGAPVNENQYEVGQAVLLKGKDFLPNTQYSWDISPAAGGPNAVAIASGFVTTDANGDFCFTAIPSLPEGSEDNDPFKATVGGAKSDNFSVNESVNSNGTIVVVKELVNEPEGVTADDFSFTVNGGDAVQFDLDGSNNSIQNLNDGPFTVVEVEEDGDGYATSYEGCSSIALTTAGATCTITNTYEAAPVCEDPNANNENEPLPCTYDPTQAVITVNKIVVNPDTSVTPNYFSFTVDGGFGNIFEADGSNQVVVTTAGVHNIVEVTATDYTTTYDGCSPTVVLGQSYTCTITNTFNPGSITIDKVVTGAGANQDLDFTFTGFFSPFFLLSGSDAPKVYTGLTSGEYSITEVDASDYTLTGVECKVGEVVKTDLNADADTIRIALGAGENATCTFTNAKDVVDDTTITINKVTNVASGDMFDFYLDGGVATSASLMGGQSSGAMVVTPGSHNLVEGGETGWTLNQETSSCVNESQNEVGGFDGNPYYLTLTAGDDIVCTFNNTRDTGVLQVKKVVLGSEADESAFSFQVDGGTAAAFESDGENNMTVVTGNYTVTEVANANYATVYDNCTDVAVTEGATTTCTITNRFIDTSDDSLSCSINASDVSVSENQEVTLTWESNNATDVDISGIGNNLDLDGSTSTTVANDTTYTLTASRMGDNEELESIQCQVTVDVQSGGGGGGGGSSPSPRCDAFELDGDDLSWETRNGYDMNITRNGDEIFSTTNDDVTDEGIFETASDEGDVFLLTVNRGSKDDTCRLEVDENGGGGGSSTPTPEVLGEATSVIPQGAPNTGAGGSASSLPSAFALLGMVMALMTIRGTRRDDEKA